MTKETLTFPWQGLGVPLKVAGALVGGFAALFAASGLKPAHGGTAGRCARAESSAIPDIKALPRLAQKVHDGSNIRIVAFGSSSTEGTPDIPRDAIFPAVLGRELVDALHNPVEVINKGRGGENIFNMAARLEADVLAEKPDLVVWQLGANDVLQMDGVEGAIARMQQTLDELRKRDVPVVLVDLQAAPVFEKDKDTPVMQAAITQAGRAPGVMHFHRQALMRRMMETGSAGEPELVAKDGLHMSALSHLCTGQLLARQIVKASVLVGAPSPEAELLPAP